MADADPLVGRTLGEFVVRERIGSGGQGMVYRAEQPALDREAVIKVLHNRLPVAAPENTQRFLREARLASRLDHPYAAHVYAFGAEPDGLRWIAMERVRGIPLDKMLRAGGAIPLVRLVPFLEKLCEVVHSAHELGIVHRDIKPANVMVLQRAGRLLPKLLDFGLAKIHDMPELLPVMLDDGEMVADTMSPSPPVAGLTGEGVMMGSPAYMSPEQWVDAGGAGGASDIYALGVLAFEALVGRVPFPARSVPELSKAHATQAPPGLGETFPPALSDVIARAMAKRPIDRFETPVELAAALRKASGVVERDPLPRLSDEERAAALSEAPQPLADALAALDGAHSVHQARDALWVAVRVVTRLLGVTALASRLQHGGEAPVDELRALRREGTDDEGWLTLARKLSDPLLLPELHDAAGDVLLDALLAERRALGDAPTEEQVGASLSRALPLLARLLRRLSPLWAYTWVVPKGELAEGWMGLSRPRRPSVSVDGGALVAGEPALVDARGTPVTRLHPFARVAAPAPGQPERLFLLEGPGRRAARLVAWPEGYEREDEEPWDALRPLLVDSDEARIAAEREESPFPGLRAFGSEDAERFVGREREVEALVNRLRQQSLLLIVGASGAGKSSFVRAGVLPAVPRLSAVVMRPGAAPRASLAAALRGAGRETLDGPILLVVDQLEELFTLCSDEDEREAFARVLVATGGETRVVATLRDDFLMRLEALAAFRDRVAPSLFLLQTPARADLARILREPVRRVGYAWDDPGLVDEMVAAVAAEPGALALISFTASRLWERRDRHFRQLRRKAYAALGGVGGALAQHAEETLAGLAPEERGLVREAFRRLVTVEGTRAVVDRDELRGPGVIEKLISARLLVASEGEDGRERVEVVHEALLAAWPRLVTWRREDAEGATLAAQLRDTAKQWQERGRPAGLLWRGDALAELRLWAARFPDRPSDLERAFAAASGAAETRAFRVRWSLIAGAFLALVVGIVVLLRINAEVAAQRRRVGDLAGDLEKGLVRQFVEQGRRALLADDPQLALAYLAEAHRRGADTPALRFLAAQATRATEGEERRFEHLNIVVNVAFTPDGTRVMTASLDGFARIWDATSGVLLAAPHEPNGVTCAALSPDGKLIVTGGREGGLDVWETASGKNVFTSKMTRLTRAVAFARDGLRVAASADDGSVCVAELATGRETALDGHKARVQALAFTESGRLVSGDDAGVVLVWNGAKPTPLAGHGGAVVAVAARAGLVATASRDARVRVFDENGRLISTLVHERDVHSVDFDRDGTHLATASADKTARVWDPRTGELIKRISGHKSSVAAARFSPEGTRLATASDDGTVAVWDVASGRSVARLVAHGAAVADAAWSAGSDRIVTASYDKHSVIWKVVPANEITPLVHPAAVTGAEFDATGSRLLTVCLDGVIRVWDARRAVVSRELRGDAMPMRATFSPDATLVADAEQNGSVHLWNATSAEVVAEVRGQGTSAYGVAFGPDGRTLAVGGADRNVRLFAVPTLAPLTTFAVQGLPSSLLFAPDGKQLLVAGNGWPEVWDVAAATPSYWGDAFVRDPAFVPGARAVVGAGFDQSIRVVSFPEGKVLNDWRGHLGRITSADAREGLIVTSSLDETARIWDATTGDLLSVLAGHEGPVFRVMFDPVGPRLITAGGDGRAILWALPQPVSWTEVARAAACRSPYRFDGDELRPSERDRCL